MNASMSGMAALAFVCLMLAACRSQRDSADLVLRNGNIHTLDAEFSSAQAVAVNGDRIAYVGTNREVQAWIGPHTRVVDLTGRTVVPGFIDSHLHFQSVGRREVDLNLDGCTSLEDFQRRLRSWSTTKAANEWITGRGWMEEDWPTKQFPTRDDLDAVVPDLPVFLVRADGHMAVANLRALRLAGIGRDTPNPPGGEILKDSAGNPNGLLVDRAMELVRSQIPSSTPELQIQYALRANQRALAYGLTTVHDAGSSWQTIALWKTLYQQERLAVRLYAFVRGPGADADSLLQTGPQIGLFNNHLTVRGIKLVCDGALGSRGAALLAPYADDNSSGLLLHHDEEIYPTIRDATARGIQLALHAIGDAANRKVLDLLARAQAEVPPETRAVREPRHRIEHAQIVPPEDLPRFQTLGVIPSMQPSHAIGDLHFAVRRLGLDRLAGAYAWRTLIDSGCIVAAGSDAPVEEGNPMIEFYAAVTRRDTSGYSGEGWHPELRMTRQEALRALTQWGAYAAFEEHLKGKIAVGMLADFAVLDRDLMTAPESELFRIRNVMTVVGGRIVYEQEPPPANAADQ